MDNYDSEANSINTERKKSFYRRVSVHHFHVMKDQMACCCCVPLGMAYHIIACLDIIFMIFEVVQVLEYYVAQEEDVRAQHSEAIRALYNQLFYMFAASTLFYSVPRIFMYFLTIWRTKAYGRMKRYFRTRIVTFLCLIIIQVTMFICVMLNADELSV
jgi:hypothetical protein